MQAQAITQIHPTRSAPLCRDCKYFMPGKHVWPNVEPACNHPMTPLDPVTGAASTPPATMRAMSSACGSTAALFMPLTSSAEVGGHEAGADALQPSANLSKTSADVVTQHAGEPVGAAGLDESHHQLRVGGGVALPEGRVD